MSENNIQNRTGNPDKSDNQISAAEQAGECKQSVDTAGNTDNRQSSAEPQPAPAWGRHVSEGYDDPNKATPKEDRHTDGSLELATMTRKERRVEKKRRFLETTADMNRSEKFRYFVYAYKAEILIPVVVVICICALAIGIYKISQPTALSYAIVNCKDLETLDTAVIDEGFSDYCGYDDSYGYEYVLDIQLSTTATDYVRTSDSESGNYIAFPTMCGENYYDVVITDEDGLNYLSENTIIYTLDEILGSEMYEELSDKGLIQNSPDGAGVSAEYAVDISGTEFVEKLNPGYDKVYLCFPGNSDENIENAEKFVNYVFEPGLY